MRRWPVALWALTGCPWISADELADRNDLDGDGVVGLFDCDDRDGAAGLPGLWVEDADGDRHGAGAPVSACVPPDGYVALADDCDDGDASVFPGAPERCDGVDDDCDGAVDDDDDGVSAADLRAFYPDADDDGWPDEAGTGVLACAALPGHVAFDGAWDCDDAAPAVRPDADEVCADAVDNDCDGAVDEEGVAEVVVADVDGDGFAGSEEVFRYCAPPPGFVPQDAVDGRLDCNDADAAVNPGAPSQDCDGLSGEEPPLATAVVNGVEVDVTATYSTLTFDGVERLRLCGSADRVVAWTAGPNDTHVEVLGGTLTGAPLLVDVVGTGDVTFENVIFAPTDASPLVSFSLGGHLVLRKVQASGLVGPVASLSGGASVWVEGGIWAGGTEGIVCSGCSDVELVELAASGFSGRLVQAEEASGIRPRVVAADVLVSGGGGLLEAVGADVELVRVTVEDAVAARGGAAAVASSTLSVVASSFVGNTAVDQGGALWASESDLDLDQVALQDNAAGFGGTVALVGGSFRETGSAHRGNGALDDGGAVWAAASTVISERSTYLGNEATEGGAVWLGPGTLGTWSAIDAQDNVASVAGGALVVDGAILLLSGGNLERNLAPSGGGIWFRALDLDTAVFGAQVAFSQNSVGDVNTQSFAQKVKTLVCLGPVGTCQ